MATGISLEDVPLVDDHGHPSMYEQREGLCFHSFPVGNPIRRLQERHTRGAVEAQIAPEDYREYIQAVNGRDAARLEEIERRHGIRPRMERTAQMWSTMTFNRALEIGCTELHGEWEDAERLRELSVQAREKGELALLERALDRENCQMVLCNTPRLDPASWPRKRYGWIPYIDPFLYPFGVQPAPARGAELHAFDVRFAAELDTALREQGLYATPTDFADYVAFTDRAVESFLERGAVGLKVQSAYVRSLDFRPVSEAEASRVFGDLVRGKRDETRLLEDYMARRLFLFAAEHGTPVQFHVGFGNPEPGLELTGSSPVMLQSVLRDERFNKLPVVLLHGSYPFCSEASALAWTYGNVYIDLSWMVYLQYHYLIDRLSEWLELLPAHKLLYGSDTGLPEMHLGTARLARRAMEVALNRGVEAGIWSASRAHWLGERVCYRNTCELYGVSI